MAPRRTQDKKPEKGTAPTASEIAALRRKAKKTLAEMEKHLGKERLQALLLEGLAGQGEEATAKWWQELDEEVAKEVQKTKRRA